MPQHCGKRPRYRSNGNLSRTTESVDGVGPESVRSRSGEGSRHGLQSVPFPRFLLPNRPFSRQHHKTCHRPWERECMLLLFNEPRKGLEKRGGGRKVELRIPQHGSLDSELAVTHTPHTGQSGRSALGDGEQ